MRYLAAFLLTGCVTANEAFTLPIEPAAIEAPDMGHAATDLASAPDLTRPVDPQPLPPDMEGLNKPPGAACTDTNTSCAGECPAGECAQPSDMPMGAKVPSGLCQQGACCQTYLMQHGAVICTDCGKGWHCE